MLYDFRNLELKLWLYKLQQVYSKSCRSFVWRPKVVLLSRTPVCLWKVPDIGLGRFIVVLCLVIFIRRTLLRNDISTFYFRNMLKLCKKNCSPNSF